ncbi:MAG: cytochrome D1 domain-containing protein [Pseudomonadota bacterium]
MGRSGHSHEQESFPMKEISRRQFLVFTTAAGLVGTVSSLPRTALASSATASGYVFTADELGNSISRIDLRSGRVEIARVAITPHNVQYVAAGNHLLAVGMPASSMDGHSGDSHASNPQTGRLIVLDADDLVSGKAISVDIGAHPAHVVADREGARAFATNSGDNTVSVIDLATASVIKSISTGDYPHGLRMSPDGTIVCIANVNDGSVSVVDTATLSEVDRISVGVAPVQVGFTPDGAHLYVSLRDENRVGVIDTATRKVIGYIDVGRSPIQLHATPDGRFVYVANQGTEAEPDDKVSVIDIAKARVVQTIRTGKGAHGVAVSADGSFVFITSIVDGTVSLIDVASQSVTASYKVGDGPNGITYRAK